MTLILHFCAPDGKDSWDCENTFSVPFWATPEGVAVTRMEWGLCGLAGFCLFLFSRGFFEAEGPLKQGHVPDLPFKWLREGEEMSGPTVSVQSRKSSL